MSMNLRESSENSKENKLSHKLDGEPKEQLLQWLAEGETPKHCVDLVEEQFGIKVDVDTIYWHRKENLQEITQRREFLATQIKGLLPTANSYNRMKIRDKLIQDLLDNLWVTAPVLNHDGTAKLDNNGNPIESYRLKGNHKVIDDLLNSQREEIVNLMGETEGESILSKIFKMTGSQTEEMFMRMYGQVTVKRKKPLEQK